jgi:hypothetical protein
MGSYPQLGIIGLPLTHRFARQVREGRILADVDLFGRTLSVSGAGVSKAGRPRLPMRLMVSLLYLQRERRRGCRALGRDAGVAV